MRFLLLVLLAAGVAFGGTPMKPVDTALVVTVGPLIDDTDFKTVEIAIAYDAAGMSVDLFEETSGAVTKTDLTLTTGGANDWTHKGNGYYEIEITAAQSNTEGTLWAAGVCTGVLPFESPRYQIVPANVMDSIVLGTDNLQVDTIQIAGTTQDATDLGDLASDGYNPSTDKLKGLELADTATTVTNQVTAAQNRAEMDSNSTQLAAIVADTNELQVDDIPTLIAALPTAVENRTEIDSNSTQLAAIVADTAELQTDDIPTLIAALPTAVENRTEMDSNSTQLAAIVGDTAELQTDDIPTLVAALPTAAEVNTQVDTALADIHLDHLLATTYDPASKPGTADALLNELVESDSGVSRFTENSLEQAPSGTGGDASAANQAIITTHLTELKGSGFVGSTDSNEAIRNRGDAAWGPPSDGDTLVNQDTGGTNAMQVLDTAGNPVAGAYIRCYRKVDYDADDLTTLRGSDTTNDNGAWHAYLSTGVAYTITADYEGRTDVLEVTP